MGSEMCIRDSSNSISDEQDEEIAFMELVEYVRVSVQLLYEDYRGYKNES